VAVKFLLSFVFKTLSGLRALPGFWSALQRSRGGGSCGAVLGMG
jgi:hypothetical protein